MLLLIGGKEVLPIMGRHRLFLHVLWLCKRSFRINIEVSIIGMLLFEIVFWFYLMDYALRGHQRRSAIICSISFLVNLEHIQMMKRAILDIWACLQYGFSTI
jgi:hypothetical protein